MTDPNQFDYSEYVEQPTSDHALSQLSQLADKQAAADARVKQIEAQLEKAREEYRDISERKIPELMDELGMEEFKTKTGLKIKIKETIRASIPKAKQDAAFDWLRNHGYGGLVKRFVSVSFGKGEDEMAEEAFRELIQRYEGVDDKSSVHPSTLKAFINERLAEGDEIPMDLFGVHRQRSAVID